jgi:hypothetical protein
MIKSNMNFNSHTYKKLYLINFTYAKYNITKIAERGFDPPTFEL